MIHHPFYNIDQSKGIEVSMYYMCSSCLINVLQFVLTVLWNVSALTEWNTISGAHGLKRYEPGF